MYYTCYSVVHFRKFYLLHFVVHSSRTQYPPRTLVWMFTTWPPDASEKPKYISANLLI